MGEGVYGVSGLIFSQASAVGDVHANVPRGICS